MEVEVALKELEEAWGQVAATLRMRLIQKATDNQRLAAEVEALKRTIQDMKDAQEAKSAGNAEG